MRANDKHISNAVHDRWSEPLGAITEALDRLRFGVIQLTVHDGKVMQVDVTERRRFGD